MNPLLILQILSVVDAALAVAQRFGIGLEEYRQLKAKAAAEGRDISTDDIQVLMDEAQAEIDKIIPRFKIPEDDAGSQKES